MFSSQEVNRSALLRLVICCLGLLLLTGIYGSLHEVRAQEPAAENLVDVGLYSYEIEMPDTIPVGLTTFRVANEANIIHNFEVEGQGIERVFGNVLQPGQTKFMTVDLEPGTYTVYCPVGNHRELGMEMTLTVTEEAGEAEFEAGEVLQPEEERGVAEEFIVGEEPTEAAEELLAEGEILPANPDDILVPEGFEVEVVAEGLDYPGDIAFGENGEMYVMEVGGHTYGTSPEEAPPARILRVLPDGETEVLYDNVVPLEVIREAEITWDPYRIEDLPEGLIPPLVGMTYNPDNGLLYISHRTRISVLNPETGEFQTIVDGLPNWGEFHNSKVVFGPDGMMYWVLSTQGNSGTVDGHMIRVMDIFSKPLAREIPCEDVELTGADYAMENTLTEEEGDWVVEGVYVPLGERTEYGETIEGQFWCHGAVYRAEPDGTDIERVAWGLRSVYGLDFSAEGDLVVTNNSGNIMPPRPIYDDWETIYRIVPGAWYGWPDYYSGLPVTHPRFDRPNDPGYTGEPFVHEFSLTRETRARLLNGREFPPQPLVRLPIHSAAEGMVFGRADWGLNPRNEVLVAEFGAIIPYYKEPAAWPGFRVQLVNIETGEIRDFMVNESYKPAWAADSGGLRRPLQLTWGPDGSLYVADFGVIYFTPEGMTAVPGTGVIWRVTREDTEAGVVGVEAESPIDADEEGIAEQDEALGDEGLIGDDEGLTEAEDAGLAENEEEVLGEDDPFASPGFLRDEEGLFGPRGVFRRENEAIFGAEGGFLEDERRVLGPGGGVGVENEALFGAEEGLNE